MLILPDQPAVSDTVYHFLLLYFLPSLGFCDLVLFYLAIHFFSISASSSLYLLVSLRALLEVSVSSFTAVTALNEERISMHHFP